MILKYDGIVMIESGCVSKGNRIVRFKWKWSQSVVSEDEAGLDDVVFNGFEDKSNLLSQLSRRARFASSSAKQEIQEQDFDTQPGELYMRCCLESYTIQVHKVQLRKRPLSFTFIRLPGARHRAEDTIATQNDSPSAPKCRASSCGRVPDSCYSTAATLTSKTVRSVLIEPEHSALQ